MITYLGKKKLAAALPVFAQLQAMIDLDGLKAEAEALLQLSVTFTPPSLDGILKFQAALTAALPSFTPPSVDFKADLLVKLGLLKARIELIAKLTELVFGGSVRLYEYEGQAGTFGNQIGATLAGPDASGGVAPTQQTFALVLLAEGGTAGETTLKTLRSGA